jgi:Leucine-rich repeat (LRR) protein
LSGNYLTSISSEIGKLVNLQILELRYNQLISLPYTNNAQVFYKSHSLASGGVGGTRNCRIKSKKT